jgi:hypothetical protein
VEPKWDEDEAEYGSWEFTANDILEEERKLFQRQGARRYLAALEPRCTNKTSPYILQPRV